MNYRHAFHAGNFADVAKHVLLARILAHLLRKPAPFRYVDTHAGVGLYDLDGDEATRTGEWREGVGRMAEPFAPEVEAVLAPWRSVVAAVRARHGATAYPGSPAVAREMLRRDDRAVLVEKHPEDGAALAARYAGTGNVKVLRLDGWTALGSLVPPPERRGIVLIDPPFEETGEFVRCAERLVRAWKRWPSGSFALWYPVKRPTEVAELSRALAGGVGSPTVRLELQLRPPDGQRLAGSGLVVVNPPWTLLEEASLLLPALAGRLGTGGEALCEQLVPERG